MSVRGCRDRDEAKINRRKKQYVRLVTQLIGDVTKKPNGRPVNPKVAALALLGMLNWTYQWYKPSGEVKPDEVVREFQDLFINGILGVQGC